MTSDRGFRFWLMVIASSAVGLIIGWVDSRPTWDDTGITVVSILVSSAVFGTVNRRVPWLWGLSVGGGVLLMNILVAGRFGAFPAVIVACVGSFAGSFAGRAIHGGDAPGARNGPEGPD